MSYSISVFRREVEAKYSAAEGPDFFEDDTNLLPFTSEQVESLTDALLLRGWAKKKGSTHGDVFSNDALAVQALLTSSGLYFIGASGEAVFEVSMFASELAGADFATFDPQEGVWE